MEARTALAALVDQAGSPAAQAVTASTSRSLGCREKDQAAVAEGMAALSSPRPAEAAAEVMEPLVARAVEARTPGKPGRASAPLPSFPWLADQVAAVALPSTTIE